MVTGPILRGSRGAAVDRRAGIDRPQKERWHSTLDVGVKVAKVSGMGKPTNADTATYTLYTASEAAAFVTRCAAMGLSASQEGAIVAVKVATRHDRDKADDATQGKGDCVGYAFG